MIFWVRIGCSITHHYQTSGYVRSERVNKWPNSMTDNDDDNYDDDDDDIIK